MRTFVGVVLFKADGSVLSQHRDNNPKILGPNTWAVVGGNSEGEDPKTAAARELKEETGYEINSTDLQILTEDDYVTERGMPVHRIIFYAPYDGAQTVLCNEGQEIRFITPNEFQTLIFYTGHENFLRQASEKALRSRQEIEH